MFRPGVRDELLKEREKLSQLQTDFEYNLSLLDQRDQELARYETAFSQVRTVVNSLTAENSELKVNVYTCTCTCTVTCSTWCMYILMVIRSLWVAMVANDRLTAHNGIV